MATTRAFLQTVGCQWDTAAIRALAPGDRLGVPVCDEYLRKHRRCIAQRAPLDARDRMHDELDIQRIAWGQALGGPAAVAVEASCRDRLSAAKLATAELRCKW